MKSLLVCCMVLGAVGCSGDKPSENDGSKEVTMILDYVPNTNHTGLYVALEKGYFKEEGLDVNIIEPGNDQTSATLVAAGKGEFGVSYQEDVTYALTSEDPLPIKAVATIIQHNTSGFVTAKSKNITDPSQFNNKVFSVWPSPSADAVMKAVMSAAGADYSTLQTVNDEDGGFESLANKVDIKWYFQGWDCVKAEMAGFELNYIPLSEFDERLDYYTPVIIANNKTIETDPETVSKFMSATKKGYEYAIEHPEESAEILYKYAPDYDLEFLKKSQEFLSEQYSKDSETWGMMKDSVWDNYTDFMFENGLIEEKITASKQYTNEFIK